MYFGDLGDVRFMFEVVDTASAKGCEREECQRNLRKWRGGSGTRLPNPQPRIYIYLILVKVVLVKRREKKKEGQKKTSSTPNASGGSRTPRPGSQPTQAHTIDAFQCFMLPGLTITMGSGISGQLPTANCQLPLLFVARYEEKEYIRRYTGGR
ncbi:hypothetical protein B0H16DRAFT_1459825 [Mycena metata]|uniref:Uncharacterized protein n=1 Tax=Mycena metata TaxID=1033252 RepID=A0AAD7J1T0_9AGAR|nr:hypothetical protein B0H16DRAFT_1459825 [Mycena metata]